MEFLLTKISEGPFYKFVSFYFSRNYLTKVEMTSKTGVQDL